ncbi:MAG: type I restriction enzyme HsdR N-terminal domain-containing protein [Bacteroidales bacterium]|nr:type I restriction enzyme HsdR N-terminal domain-containing protein [Bacteroidales bacterium]
MSYTLKIRENGSQQEVFDPVRQKWVVMTPEERVRQVFILYLLNIKGFPLSHLSVEHAVTVNGMTQRYDLVVFDDELNPYMVVECKAPHIKLTQKVVEQAGRYNNVLRAPFVCVTNGVERMVFSVDFETGEVRRLEG